jgi:two-component sensor histidine kinase
VVDIHWTTGNGRLHIEWRERGGPPVSAPLRQGFGLRMIERALAADLAGTATVTFAPEGLYCVIDAPEPGSPA